MAAHLNTTPVRSQREGTPTSILGGPSPHYVAGKRYAFYGNDDRVLLDVGSKYIKYGFTSEAAPRGVLDLSTCGAPASGLWSLQTRWDARTVKETTNILQKALRRLLQLDLMLDARSRKIVLVEHPLWPRQIKSILANILFNNLQVPSLSTVPSHLSALLASGVTTGLVIDVGHLEATLLPVFAARPLYLHLQSTSCAGLRLLHRLKALLLHFGRYSPPPPLSVSSTHPSPSSFQDVPEDMLTYPVLLDLLHHALFISPKVPDRSVLATPLSDLPAAPTLEDKVYDEAKDVRWMRQLEACYRPQSSASALTVTLRPVQTTSGPTNVKSSLLVPGWIREHAADVLFEPGNEDEPSIVQSTLMTLLKLPIDLRKTMCSQLLITGGLSMLPGFFTRFRNELKQALCAYKTPVTSSPPRQRTRVSPLIPKRTEATRFSPIAALHRDVAILNDPCMSCGPTEDEEDELHPNSGTAPGFSPSLLPWIGGSLSVALKTTGHEIVREQWLETQNRKHHREGGVDYSLPDWSMPSLGNKGV